MKNRARVVVIGGGVGGCSILYWLTRLGWSDVVLVDRAELTSGSTFHSAGLVGQLRELAQPDEDDDELGRALPHARRGGRPRDRLARGRLAAARLVARADGGAHPPVRLGEDVRASARADLGRGGAGALPADDDRRRARRRVPPDRRLHRPLAAHVRARRGRAPRRRRDLPAHPRHRDPRRARPRDRRRHRQGRDRGRGRRQRRRDVREGDRRARRRERPDRPDGARVPDHQAVRASRPTCRRCATRRCSSTSGPSRAA